MSQTEEKTILVQNDHCLEAIFQYLDFGDIVSLKEASKAFHGGISLSLQTRRVISLRCFGSVKIARSFFRDIPFKLQILDMIFRGEINERSKNKYLSTVLNEINSSNLTHLRMGTEKFENRLVLEKFVRKCPNVHNFCLYLIEADRIKELTIICPALHRNERFPDNSMPESSDFSIFLKMLRKHASRLRSFKFVQAFNSQVREQEYSHLVVESFHNVFINTLSELSPNLDRSMQRKFIVGSEFA